MRLNALSISPYMPDLSGWNAGVTLSEEEQEALYLMRRELHALESAPRDSDPKFFLRAHQQTVELALLAARNAAGGFDFFM